MRFGRPRGGATPEALEQLYRAQFRAIRIVSSDGNLTLVVGAATFEPIEWSWENDDGISETSRFQTYEWLPATDSNLALLSLTAQHPGATIRQDATVSGTEGEGK